MEELQYQHANVNVRSMNNNNLWVGRSKDCPPPSHYEPSRFRHVMKPTKTKSSSTWWWNDPEKKRARRVAKYKFYEAEGKCKHSVKKGWRWLKIKYIKIITSL